VRDILPVTQYLIKQVLSPNRVKMVQYDYRMPETNLSYSFRHMRSISIQ